MAQEEIKLQIPDQPSKLFKVMCDGIEFALKNPRVAPDTYLDVDMDTFGELIYRGEAANKERICVGCAATYTILQLAQFSPDKIIAYFEKREHSAHYNGFAIEQTATIQDFETMINNIRLGDFEVLYTFYTMALMEKPDVLAHITKQKWYEPLAWAHDTPEELVCIFRESVIPWFEKFGL